MAIVSAFIDANVFYSIAATDLLVEIAKADLYRARWSERVHDEWTSHLLRNRPDLDPSRIARRRRAMDTAVPDACVTGFEELLLTLALPDPKDRHVLAAAITGKCTVIVTFNQRDFPQASLAPHGLAAVHPDRFLLNLFDSDTEGFLACIAATRARLLNPPHTVDKHLARLARVGLPRLAAVLGGHRSAL